MKYLKVAVAAIACLSLGALVPSVAYAQPLPKVWVGGPNPAPCYNTVEVHGKYVNHKIACYEVRPSTIALSEDGNGFLSDLHWTTWSMTNAVAMGTKYQRCYFPLGNQGPRCVGKLGGGYNVPVTVFLAKPVQTVDGLLFSVLTEAGQPGQWCITPFGTGCNVPPPTRTTTTASSVSGLAGAWEYVGFAKGCAKGCFLAGYSQYEQYAIDIVRLTIVDFPAGTLSGTWQEATCVVNGAYYQLADLDLPTLYLDNGPNYGNFAISGKGIPSSFTINVSTDALFGNTFSGGTGNLPFGVSGYGLWYPDRLVYDPPVGGKATAGQSYQLPNTTSRPRLFLLTGGSKAAVFYPASDYNPMGVCGVLAEPKLIPAKH